MMLLLMFGTILGVEAQEVVVHPSVSQETISRNTLRAIFGMRLRRWPDGSVVKVFVLRDDAELHKKFSKSILHLFPYQLRRAWDRQVFSGTGQSPQEVISLESMRAKITHTPGAIGYLPIGNTEIGMKILNVR